MNKHQKGFTLIELMIVVAIIGILAAIAIPNFIKYQLKTKQAEAKTVIGGIKTSEEAFRAEYDHYANVTPNPAAVPGATKDAWVADVCGACSRQNVAGCTQWDCIGYTPNGEVYFQYDVDSTAVGVLPDFTAEANSDLDGDAAQGRWAYGTDNGDTGAVPIAPMSGCTNADFGPGEVMDCEPGVF